MILMFPDRAQLKFDEIPEDMLAVAAAVPIIKRRAHAACQPYPPYFSAVTHSHLILINCYLHLIFINCYSAYYSSQCG
jgi:hypothetical protein